ncbi:MAG: hypothetical protein KA717_27335 [Woronichinia naegeliana WA131]|uniref:Uncharacterized protein n=1 Tax=Woronichinia naegeliana WA131 TaxID=2824559 RepID=A0A977PVE6_9CYAN|nr:MAG: hypothetical protein KA717_27335 [Woronichinia naegeliana WA131]
MSDFLFSTYTPRELPTVQLQGTHEKMMRDRVLNLPVMVALVLSIVYRQIVGISALVST